MGREVLQTSDMTSDLEESIVNQYKSQKRKFQLGSLNKDHTADEM